MSAADPVATFRQEAEELLEQIEQGLLDLEARPGDRELVNSVFRGLHTLKGSGAMFGFDALAAFTHHCETAFDRVRKGEVPLTPELLVAVLAAQDHMRALIEGTNAPAEAGEALLAALRLAVEGAGDPPATTAAADARKTWRIRFRLPANAIANGANPLALLDELRELGEAEVAALTDAIPMLEDLEPTECHLAWEVVLTTDQPRSAVDDVFIFLIDDMELNVEEVASAAPITDVVDDAEDSPTEGDLRAEAPAAADPRSGKASETVRVPAERLDELMDRVGELVIAQSRLKQLAAASVDVNLRAVSEEIERLSNELRDTMMVVRMVPIATLFSRFRRLTHDLARETGKSIELVTSGEATELDKTIIERLADPLIHLFRNAVDHGLETAEARVAAGKPPSGRVELSARHSGAEVIITLSDDGRGVDRDRVRARAEETGLLTPGANASDAELLQLIFHPGFSTASQVTNLSGRGVGMDVVKRTIDALRGSIEIDSRPGEGSEVVLRIPLTLAIIDGLLVRVDQSRYVIPLSAVEECVELSVEEDARSSVRSVISLRDEVVPFLRLRDLFATGSLADPHQKIVVITTGEERVGLVVDQIIGDHQTVIKSLSELHADVGAFSGATILGDGAVALILDVSHLVEAGRRQHGPMREAG